MGEFLAVAFGLPTALYTVPLIFVSIYWMLAIVGLFDLDTPDADVGMDGDLDMDLDGPDLDLDGPDLDLDGPDLDLDGPDLDLDGPDLDAGGLGADLDMDLDGPDLDGPDLDGPDADVDAPSVGLLTQALVALGFARVPLTVSLTFLIFFAWITTYSAVAYLAPLVPQLATVIDFAAPVVAMAVAVPPASLAVRPFAPLFHIHKASRRRSFIGHTCEVTTGRVDDRFGQAEIADGGAGLTVQVRCDHDNALGRGGEALVVSYDDEREAYVVEPLHTPRGQQLKERADKLLAARMQAKRRKGRSRR